MIGRAAQKEGKKREFGKKKKGKGKLMLKRNEQQTRKKCATERRSSSFEEITQTAAGSNGET